MFFFKKQQQITHKEASLIGFVLAVMSVLTTAVVSFVMPFFNAWIYTGGAYGLEVFLLMTFGSMYLAVQGLLLFGFPLYYAQDKKSHMTGFQILIYTLMWSFAMVVLIGVLAVALGGGELVYS